ncbi:MAG: hypothetical protein M0R31_08425 [Candidatus Riflebacteria bacterium]|nr:hypothetical protein [Candidatus Riflebacteria bacterium]
MDLNYEEDVKIDPEALDVEWLGQADLMRRYTKHSALMEKEADEAKERLEAGKARIEMEIRSNPEKYGLLKVTEASVSSAVLLQKEYQALVQEHINTKYEANVAKGAVRAIDQRKVALENLVNLFGRSYFAGPKTPRDLSSEWLKEKKRKESNTKVKIRRKKVRAREAAD